MGMLAGLFAVVATVLLWVMTAFTLTVLVLIFSAIPVLFGNKFERR